jgi:hypothetical protein
LRRRHGQPTAGNQSVSIPELVAAETPAGACLGGSG